MSAVAKKNELLVTSNIITNGQLVEAEKVQKEKNISLHEALVDLGFVDGDDLAKKLAEQHKVPYMDLGEFNPSQEILGLVSPSFCRKHNLLPVSKVGNRCLVVATSDPGNRFIKTDLETVTQMSIQIVVANALKIKEEINKLYSPKSASATSVMTELEKAESDYVTAVDDDSQSISAADSDGVVIKFVNAILSEAIQTNASDIHIEIYEGNCRVRYRVDGVLQEKLFPPKGAAAAIASRIKIMSKLDIAEKRRPQDGRMKVKSSAGKIVDFRVSVIPVLHGEKIVMRLLDKSNLTVTLDQLHLSPEEREIISRNIHQPQGMVLMTGPTGSGKTTTIYSILNELNDKSVNITTAEDPVEYNIEGINQVQVNSEIGFGFSEALRSFLRQDPNIIMVGEIRDLETAEIAFKAASTGHLVVSTLHTNSSIATISRLIDIGIQSYIITDTVSLVIAQRLVRKVCQHCVEPYPLEENILLDLGIKKEQIAEFQNTNKGVGCNKCNYSGYRGRVPIFEILEMTPVLREAIIKGESAGRVKTIALEAGLITLRQSALTRLKEGMTTVEEVVNASVGD